MTMTRNFIIGVSLVALGVIVAGSLDSTRIASLRLTATEGRGPLHAERATRQIGWQPDLALPQSGAAALHLARMPPTRTSSRWLLAVPTGGSASAAQHRHHRCPVLDKRARACAFPRGIEASHPHAPLSHPYLRRPARR